MRGAYPFSAIVGQDELKQALLIAAIDPTIGDVLGRCCMGRRGGRADPNPRLRSGDADGVRASQLQHAVEDVNSDVDLGRPALVRVRVQAVADDGDNTCRFLVATG